MQDIFINSSFFYFSLFAVFDFLPLLRVGVIKGIANQFGRGHAEPRKRLSFSFDANASCVETAQSSFQA